MKKVILILSAVAAIAACSKNEVISVSSNENTEITFNVAPKTKAINDGDTRTDFSHDNVFVSYAYALNEDATSWKNNYEDAQEFINGAVISYVNGANVWKNADKTYYWPKVGSLTFFAWSLNTPEDKLDAYKNAVGCSKENGISANLDAVAKMNMDFMVADIQTDKKSNSITYEHNGVPTLFRHKLSYIVFNVRTDKDYSASKTITVNSIKFLGVASKGSYSQLENGAVSEKMDASDPADQTYTSASQVVTSEFQPITSVDQFLYIPQNFENAGELEISYSVVTKKEYTNGSADFTENLVKKIPVNELFDSWAMGKRYTFKLTFSLDEILWDPAVEDWTDVAGGGIIIEQ